MKNRIRGGRMTHLSRKFFLINFVLLVVGGVQAVERTEYSYPVKDSYVATVSSAATSLFLRSKGSIGKKITLNIFPDRNNLPFYQNRNKVVSSISLHRGQRRPLVFILGGFGASAQSDTSRFLMWNLKKRGYHVVSIASPFFWQFNLSAMTDGTPGIIQRDSFDVYKVMLNTYLKAQQKYSFEVSDFYLLGYSLGGLESVFVDQIDQSQTQHFDFKKVIAINPPVSLKNSARLVDSYIANWKSLGEGGQKRLSNKIFDVFVSLGQSFANKEVSQSSIFQITKSLPLSTLEARALIGQQFHESLRSTIFLSELISQRGDFEIFEQHFSPQPGLQNAAQFNLNDYLTKVIIPYYRSIEPGISINQIFYKLSLKSKKSYIENNSRLYVVHNADDPIITPADLSFIKQSYGAKRSLIYPRGGHLGNIWHSQNLKDIFNILDEKIEL